MERASTLPKPGEAPWAWSIEGYLDQVARKRSTAKLVQRLGNLGYDVMLVPKAA